MEKVRDIHIGVPYSIELQSDESEGLQLDVNTTMVCVFVPTQNKRYTASLSPASEEGVLLATWTAEQTSLMAPSAPTLEVYQMSGENVVDILLRSEAFTSVKRVSVSTDVKEG